jgi:hypothetical protein
VQRFGLALNTHIHRHCCVTDGVFSVDAAGSARFHPAVYLAEATISTAQRPIRTRALRLAVRWGHGGGFSRTSLASDMITSAGSRLWAASALSMRCRLVGRYRVGMTADTLMPAAEARSASSDVSP